MGRAGARSAPHCVSRFVSQEIRAASCCPAAQQGPSVQASIMSPPASPPPALLLEELVEEVLLRLPPDDPAGLVRVALVCKIWCRVISGPAFRRRFREFHRAPPMLGFFVNLNIISDFVRTSSTCPPIAARRNWRVIDARHGRVLLKNLLEERFVVWDPITDHWRELPLLSMLLHSWNAAVLCAASLGGTCDHLDCHRGPFLVVLVGNNNSKMWSYVYTSEDGAWSEPNSVQRCYCSIYSATSATIAGNALYFSCWNNRDRNILKYDLGTKEMSVIRVPVNYFGVPMTMECGGLGFATMVNSTLYLWSWEVSHDRGAGCAESRSIELETLLPAHCYPASLYVIGCADSIGVIFLHADVGILTVDLNSIRVTKVWKENWLCAIFPYVSFYTPGKIDG